MLITALGGYHLPLCMLIANPAELVFVRSLDGNVINSSWAAVFGRESLHGNNNSTCEYGFLICQKFSSFFHPDDLSLKYFLLLLLN